MEEMKGPYKDGRIKNIFVQRGFQKLTKIFLCLKLFIVMFIFLYPLNFVKMYIKITLR